MSSQECVSEDQNATLGINTLCRRPSLIMELHSFLNSSYKASTSFTVTVKQSKVPDSEI